MGLRFRRSIKLGKFAKINLGKTGASLSLGVKGAHVTVGKNGVRKTVTLPGTGVSYTDYKRYDSKNKGASNLRQSNIAKPISLEPRSIEDYNKRVLSAANKKLLKICLIIFFSCAFLDVLLFKGNGILLQVIFWIVIIGYIDTRVSMHKKYKGYNEDNIKM